MKLGAPKDWALRKNLRVGVAMMQQNTDYKMTTDMKKALGRMIMMQIQDKCPEQLQTQKKEENNNYGYRKL